MYREVRLRIFALPLLWLSLLHAHSAQAQSSTDDIKSCVGSMNSGDPAGAVRLCSRALQSRGLSDRQTAKTLNIRAAAYVHLEQFQLALADLDRAVSLEPSMAQLYANRGGVRSILGYYDLAIEDLNQAITLQPNDATALSNRGFARIQKRQYDLAIKDLSRAIELDPDNQLPYSNRGAAYFETGDYNEAIADYSRSIALRPSATGYMRRAEAHLALGDPAQARADCLQAVQLDPDGDGVVKYEQDARHFRCTAAGPDPH